MAKNLVVDVGTGNITETDDIITLPDVDVITWQFIRLERNAKLAASDWVMLQDSLVTGTKLDKWKDYRQALRDIPQRFSNPNQIVWPEPPK